MPIYEYVCEKCGDIIEVMQKVNESPLKRCQKCRGKLEKMISRTSFQLKGGGWYMTDYSRKTTSTGANKAEKGAEKKSDGVSSSDTAGGTGDRGACE